jgi:DNA-binding XRE family transcriptional regulator
VTWTDASEADLEMANERFTAIQDELAKALGISDDTLALAESAQK